MIFAYYEHNIEPLAVKFPDGWFIQGITWYGLSYVAGFLIALGLLALYTKKGRSPLTQDQNSSLAFYMFFGVVVGARLGYLLFYKFSDFAANPLIFFKVWQGGMASHGGFIGVILALLIFCKVHKVSFFKISDIIATICGPGIFLGRLANFINGELWGKLSNVPWAVRFQESAPTLPLAEVPPRHPSQLYEAFGEGLLIFIILQLQFWKTRPPAGQIAGEFFLLYAAARIICEHFFREPDVGITFIMGMSRGSFYSLFCVLIGIFFIAWAQLKSKRGLESR